MKNKLPVVLLMALVLIVGGWKLTPTQYEYKFEYNLKEKKANELGAQGWELVALTSSGSDTATSVEIYVFKRAK